MNRASAQPASRAADRLIGSARPCSCDESKRLAERLAKLHELADRLEAENAVLRAELGLRQVAERGLRG